MEEQEKSLFYWIVEVPIRKFCAMPPKGTDAHDDLQADFEKWEHWAIVIGLGVAGSGCLIGLLLNDLANSGY